MLSNLTNVFELCREHDLKLHPEKCSFFMNEVTYLGHKCTDKGILPDDSKYSAIKNYPTPTDADSAKRFVAFCTIEDLLKNFLIIQGILLDYLKREYHSNGQRNATMLLIILKQHLLAQHYYNTQT